MSELDKILDALDAEDDYVRSWKLARQIRAALPAHVQAARADAWDEGWNDRDGDCSEPYSPPRFNPYRTEDA